MKTQNNVVRAGDLLADLLILQKKKNTVLSIFMKVMTVAVMTILFTRWIYPPWSLGPTRKVFKLGSADLFYF